MRPLRKMARLLADAALFAALSTVAACAQQQPAQVVYQNPAPAPRTVYVDTSRGDTTATVASPAQVAPRYTMRPVYSEGEAPPPPVVIEPAPQPTYQPVPQPTIAETWVQNAYPAQPEIQAQPLPQPQTEGWPVFTDNAAPATVIVPGYPAATPQPTYAPLPSAPYGVGGYADPNAPVTVALLLPLGDKRAGVRTLAKAIENAAVMAAEDAGVSTLAIRSYDTKGDSAGAAAAAREALSGGAKLILGPLFSGSVAAVRQEAAPYGVSAISFTTDETVLGGGAWSIGFLPSTEINRIIGYAARRGKTDIAAFAPNSPFGQVVYRGAYAAAEGAGAVMARVQPYQPEFEAVENAAKEFAQYYKSRPQLSAVLLPEGGQTLQAIASYLAYFDVLPRDVKYLGLGSWEDEATFKDAALRGGWFAAPDRALRAQFEARYAERFSETPPALARLGFDAAAVAAFNRARAAPE